MSNGQNTSAMTPSHKRRPLPNWVRQGLDAAKMDLECAQKYYDRMLELLEKGNGNTAGIVLAKMGRRQSDALREIDRLLSARGKARSEQ